MAKLKEATQPTERLLPTERGRISHKFISRAFAGLQSERPGSKHTHTPDVSPEPGNPSKQILFGYDINGMGYNCLLTLKYPVEIREGKEIDNISRRLVTLEVIKYDGPHDGEEHNVLSSFTATATYSYGERFGNTPPYIEAFRPVDGSVDYRWYGTNNFDATIPLIETEFSNIFQNEHMTPQTTGEVTFDLQREIDLRLRKTPEYTDELASKAETGLMQTPSDPGVMENTFVIGDQRITVSRMLQGVGGETERVETESLYVIDIEDLDPDNHNSKPKGTTRIQLSTRYSFLADFKTGDLITSDLKHHDGSIIVLKDGELYLIDDTDPQAYKEIRGMIPFLNTDPFEYFHPQPAPKSTGQ